MNKREHGKLNGIGLIICLKLCLKTAEGWNYGTQHYHERIDTTIIMLIRNSNFIGVYESILMRLMLTWLY